MSKINDSKNLDRSESLPASRFSSLFHTNVTSVEMRELQSSVRKTNWERGPKLETMNLGQKIRIVLASKKKAGIETRVLEDRNSRVFDIETED